MARRSSLNVTQDHEAEPSEVQLQAIDLLVAGKSKAEVARALDLARETVSRWHKDPVFIAALNQARYDIHAAFAERIRGLTAKAFDVIEDQLADSETSQVRQRAAIAMLQLAIRLPEPRGPTDPAEVRRDQLLSGWSPF